MAWNSASGSAEWPARSVPAIRWTRFRPATCPALRSAPCADRTRRRQPPEWASSGRALETPPAPTSCTDKIGLFGAQLPAAVDDFLRAALDFRVAALHRGEIEVFGIGTGRHRRSGAAAEADQHAGAAELDEQRADREGFILERLLGLDAAQAAGDHDRLVVAAHRAGDVLLVGAEIAGQVRAAEFVVERSGADRAFEHDVERRGDARRAAVGDVPTAAAHRA
jgi:hypothetical protein